MKTVKSDLFFKIRDPANDEYALKYGVVTWCFVAVDRLEHDNARRDVHKTRSTAERLRIIAFMLFAVWGSAITFLAIRPIDAPIEWYVGAFVLLSVPLGIIAGYSQWLNHLAETSAVLQAEIIAGKQRRKYVTIRDFSLHELDRQGHVGLVERFPRYADKFFGSEGVIQTDADVRQLFYKNLKNELSDTLYLWSSRKIMDAAVASFSESPIFARWNQTLLEQYYSTVALVEQLLPHKNRH